MTIVNLIDAERLTFAKLATDTARRTGARDFSNLSLIRCDGGLALICADIGGECVTHGLELPADAWTPTIEAEVVRLFTGSAQLALRQLGRCA